MKASENAKKIIRSFESFSEKAYFCPAKKLTIGFGHLVKDNSEIIAGMVIERDGENVKVTRQAGKSSSSITLMEGEDILDSDLSVFEVSLTNLLHNIPTTQNQFDAMVSLAFNIGIGNFSKSSVFKNHKAKNYEKAAQSFKLWNKATISGTLTVLKGLTRRRTVEENLYRG